MFKSSHQARSTVMWVAGIRIVFTAALLLIFSDDLVQPWLTITLASIALYVVAIAGAAMRQIWGPIAAIVVGVLDGILGVMNIASGSTAFLGILLSVYMAVAGGYLVAKGFDS